MKLKLAKNSESFSPLLLFLYLIIVSRAFATKYDHLFTLWFPDLWPACYHMLLPIIWETIGIYFVKLVFWLFTSRLPHDGYHSQGNACCCISFSKPVPSFNVVQNGFVGSPKFIVISIFAPFKHINYPVCNLIFISLDLPISIKLKSCFDFHLFCLHLIYCSFSIELVSSLIEL